MTIVKLSVTPLLENAMQTDSVVENTLIEVQVTNHASEVAGNITASEKTEVKDLEPTRYGDWEKNGRCIDF